MPHNDQLQFGEDAALVALRAAWENALEEFSVRVDRPLFENCLKRTVPVSFQDGHIVLNAASSFAKFWLENKYLNEVRTSLGRQLNSEVTVSVRVMREEQEQPEEPSAAEAPAESSGGFFDVHPAPAREVAHSILNDGYTFDTFVVGPSNRMAFAASSAVAKSPGCSYNPLFIYGGPGLGKTHLLHAIGNFLQTYQPGVGMLYTTAEKFTSDYVEAVSQRKTTQFRRRYRDVDVFLIDDIQFLVDKERTREEFFHTFNALHGVGRQVVLSSDRPPSELELDTRLTSRFEAGLVVDIACPDLETRMAIINAKAERQDLEIPNDVVLYIARLIRSNIRAIEGALLKLHMYTSVMNMPVSTEIATDILARHFDHPQENLITPESVQDVVARHFGVKKENLTSLSREAKVVLARQVAMYLLRHLTSRSLPAIGKAFGGKDHSTVLYAIKKISKLVVEDARTADDIAALTRELKKGS